MNKNELIRVENLKKYFELGGGFFSRSKEVVKAVDGLNFTIFSGETLGIVGESGCGKSTTGRLLMRLLEPTKGDIFYKDKNLVNIEEKELKDMFKENPENLITPKLIGISLLVLIILVVIKE